MSQCSICEAEISVKVAEFSMSKYGKNLCMMCQKLEKSVSKPEVIGTSTDTNRNNLSINPKFIKTISGKEFITSNGLLEIANQRGGIAKIEILEKVYDRANKVAYATVRVVMKNGEVYEDCGSATPENLTNVKNYPLEMAVTRARSRALRFGLNVDYVSTDEVE